MHLVDSLSFLSSLRLWFSTSRTRCLKEDTQWELELHWVRTWSFFHTPRAPNPALRHIKLFPKDLEKNVFRNEEPWKEARWGFNPSGQDEVRWLSPAALGNLSGPPWYESLQVQMLFVTEESFINFPDLKRELVRAFWCSGIWQQVSLICLWALSLFFTCSGKGW